MAGISPFYGYSISQKLYPLNSTLLYPLSACISNHPRCLFHTQRIFPQLGSACHPPQPLPPTEPLGPFSHHDYDPSSSSSSAKDWPTPPLPASTLSPASSGIVQLPLRYQGPPTLLSQIETDTAMQRSHAHLRAPPHPLLYTFFRAPLRLSLLLPLDSSQQLARLESLAIAHFQSVHHLQSSTRSHQQSSVHQSSSVQFVWKSSSKFAIQRLPFSFPTVQQRHVPRHTERVHSTKGQLPFPGDRHSQYSPEINHLQFSHSTHSLYNLSTVSQSRTDHR
jgi:hypothetical protein